ncbi:MAG: hypothetical protein NZ583_06460 [Desulfobacterota bacterium]|nr:hypothetical protein [Thermodesulfobacteriota bacterium]MDW8002480.1 hypothetical protein [Deltaproteobacteria bacterium]
MLIFESKNGKDSTERQVKRWVCPITPCPSFEITLDPVRVKTWVWEEEKGEYLIFSPSGRFIHDKVPFFLPSVI